MNIARPHDPYDTSGQSGREPHKSSFVPCHVLQHPQQDSYHTHRVRRKLDRRALRKRNLPVSLHVARSDFRPLCVQQDPAHIVLPHTGLRVLALTLQPIIRRQPSQNRVQWYSAQLKKRRRVLEESSTSVKRVNRII